jgi:hypothetical protein
MNNAVKSRSRSASSAANAPPVDYIVSGCEALANAAQRIAELQERIAVDPPIEYADWLAFFAAAETARAVLSAENLHSLARAIREGKLPRRASSARC